MGFDFVEKVITIGGGDSTSPLLFYKKGFNLGSGSPSWQDIVLSGNGSLSLTAALANGLNYLKLFGGTEQRNLPSGYTQVEYLQSSGTQYIDLGKISSNDVIDIKCEWTQVSNNYLLGSLEDGSNWQIGKMLGITYYTLNARAFYNRGATTSSTGGTPASFNITANTEYTIHWQPSSNQITVNGTQYTGAADNKNQTTDVFETANNLYLFCANRGGVAGSFDYVKMREFSIVGKRNLIPCRRNSDSVLGMYDTVSGNFLTNSGTGTFTAGSDITAPSPDTPIDIVCNNGVVKVSRNLFDKDTINTVLGSIDGNGNFTSATNRARSEYIPVVASQTYTLSINNSNIQVVPYYYNSSKTFLSYDGGWKTQPFTFTVPNNCSYLCVLYKDVSTEALQLSSIKDIQLEQGSTATPYAPYSPNGIYTDGTTETVEVHTKNLYNPATAQDGYLTDTGGFTPSIQGKTSAFIQVKPSTTYTLKFLRTFQDIYTRVCSYDSNEDFLTLLIKDTDLSQGYRTETFTTDANAKYIRVSFKADSTEVQVEEGSTATTYEPYFNGGSALAENLLKVGTYQDVQEVLSGNVTRNIGVKVLDGTENWGFTSQRAYLEFPECKSEGNATLTISYCSHFTEVETWDASLPSGFAMYTGSLGGSVYLHMSGRQVNVSTGEQFKQWLADQYNAGTPVIVVYPLATATTETVTGQPMSIQAGTNIVEITQASIDNLGLEVSYKAVV